MTQDELAEKVGVTGPCISFWEAGKTRPRDANLTALCKALKLPIRATREIASG
jgi:DNA-binding XRE family transcriptional regulator